MLSKMKLNSKLANSQNHIFENPIVNFMDSKLIVKNFGPIKNVELDLRNVNVFIGQQATGKTPPCTSLLQT
jgi:recombinational DNA repair ATPase RecF